MIQVDGNVLKSKGTEQTVKQIKVLFKARWSINKNTTGVMSKVTLLSVIGIKYGAIIIIICYKTYIPIFDDILL